MNVPHKLHTTILRASLSHIQADRVLYTHSPCSVYAHLVGEVVRRLVVEIPEVLAGSGRLRAVQLPRVRLLPVGPPDSEERVMCCLSRRLQPTSHSPHSVTTAPIGLLYRQKDDSQNYSSLLTSTSNSETEVARFFLLSGIGIPDTNPHQQAAVSLYLCP